MWKHCPRMICASHTQLRGLHIALLKTAAPIWVAWKWTTLWLGFLMLVLRGNLLCCSRSMNQESLKGMFLFVLLKWGTFRKEKQDRTLRFLQIAKASTQSYPEYWSWGPTTMLPAMQPRLFCCAPSKLHNYYIWSYLDISSSSQSSHSPC